MGGGVRWEGLSDVGVLCFRERVERSRLCDSAGARVCPSPPPSFVGAGVSSDSGCSFASLVCLMVSAFAASSAPTVFFLCFAFLPFRNSSSSASITSAVDFSLSPFG